MRFRSCRFVLSLISVLAALAVLPIEAGLQSVTRDVILAIQRGRRLNVFDAATLEPLGHFRIDRLGETVRARGDGRVIFFRQQTPVNPPGGCCGLFALDLETKNLCHLVEPSGQVVLTPDDRLFLRSAAMSESKSSMRKPSRPLRRIVTIPYVS